MTNTMQPKDHAERVASIPGDLPILPLRNTVAYPFSVLPLVVGIPRSVKLIEDSFKGDRLIGLLTMKDASVEEPGPDQIYEIGTVAAVYYVKEAPDKTLQVVVQGLERFRVERWLGTEPYLRAHIALAPDVVEPGVELDALQRSLRDLAQEVVALSPSLPEEAGKFLNQVQDPRYLAYLVAANARLELAEGQKILETDSVKDKLRALISHLAHEKEVLSLGQKIQTEAREEIDKAQREYYLRQQLKAIQKELGETGEGQSAAAEYTEKIEKANLPEEAKKEAQR
jgi:ATP-dependent Lon protease